MESMLQDLRYALRAMLRAPGFAIAAILSLGLGIGANTAVFSVLDNALLRPLPVHEPQQLVHLNTARGTGRNANYSYQHYAALRDHGPFTGVLAHSMTELAVRVGDVTEQLNGVAVSANYFDVLGVQAGAGRYFATDEDVPGAPRDVVVISHGFWQRRLGGNADALGQRLLLNGKPYTIIGVAPQHFNGIVRGYRNEFWLPVTSWLALLGYDFIDDPGTSWLDVMARMPGHLDPTQLQARLSALDTPLREQKLLAAQDRNVIVPAAAGLTAAVGSLRRPLNYMLAAVALVLLIACANVTNLLLARASTRQRELAVRIALGGTRGRVARQLFTEALVLTCAAGGIGILLAIWISEGLASWPTGFGTVDIDTSLDMRVLGFTIAITALTGLLFGTLPALQAARSDLMPAMKERGGRPARVTARSVLVVAQVALSLTLLVGATMLVRTLRNLADVDIGYTTRTALLAEIDLDAQRYEPAAGRAFINQLMARVRALPGVVNASAATAISPTTAGSAISGVDLEGFAGNSDDVGFDYARVEPAFFETLGMPIVRGRGFTAADATTSTTVAVINQHMANRFWPNGDALGKHVFLDSARTRTWQIIGIVADGKYRTLREDATPILWRPLTQSYVPRLTLIVRTQGEPLVLANAVRGELRALDAGVPLFKVRSLEQHIAAATGEERLAARVAGGFSLVALVLAALGIYAVLAFVVAQRRREIGIRMALGAHRREVLAMILQRGFLLTAIGVAAGIPGAMLSARLMQSLVYGVEPGEISTYLTAAALLVTVAVAAAVLPARRASGVDPLITLRQDGDT